MTPETASLRERVRAAQADPRLIAAVRLATWRKVEQRAAGMAELRNPDELRALAAQIKQHTLENLPRYLGQFAAALRARGAQVHLAADAAAAREIIVRIARGCGARLAVKSKSMTSEEIHLNEALAAAGVRTVETDLGEFIVQIEQDRPSHIVTPIIHKDRRQVARAMQRELGCPYTEDPAELTRLARAHLREIFRTCDLGISGVNFGVAESGTLCLCTNEGNGRMTVTRPRVHIALMGIEKLIPRRIDLSVFLKLLARSSTGQPLTVYTTLIDGPRAADEAAGPQELHVVLLDAGRSALLHGPYASVLRCIRCGACLNACPVYRNIGGHAYASVYPGPIGALVTPLLGGLAQHPELPRASSLCGACAEVCPVKIDIPELLVRLRRDSRGSQSVLKRAALRVWALAMRHESLYRLGQRTLRAVLVDEGDGWATSGPAGAAGWLAARDLPMPPARSFRELWAESLSAERGGRT